MSDNTKIEWSNATWNPVTGCTKVSPGCDFRVVAERAPRPSSVTLRHLRDPDGPGGVQRSLWEAS